MRGREKKKEILCENDFHIAQAHGKLCKAALCVVLYNYIAQLSALSLQ